MAAALCAEGAKVAVSSRSRENIEAAASEMGAAGSYVHDMSDLDGAPALLDGVEADLGPLAVLVTNTGGPPGGDPLEFTREQWQDAHRELMLGPMALIERALQGQRERGFGAMTSLSAARDIRGSGVDAHRSGIWHLPPIRGQVGRDGRDAKTTSGRIATAPREPLGSLDEPRMARDEVPAARLGRTRRLPRGGLWATTGELRDRGSWP